MIKYYIKSHFVYKIDFANLSYIGINIYFLNKISGNVVKSMGSHEIYLKCHYTEIHENEFNKYCKLSKFKNEI